MRIVVAVGLAALLSACQTASYQGDENSPYYVVPAGSRLVLNQKLSVEPDQVGVYVQHGKIMKFTDVDKYAPFCKFELSKRVDQARTVDPDEIEIIKAIQDPKYHTFARAGLRQTTPQKVRFLAQGGAFDSGGPSLQSFTVQMDLRSSSQPDIFRMTCGRWSTYPSTYEHLSIAEIRRTLEPLFTLRTLSKG